MRENGLTDVSVIKSSNGMLEYYIENEGKVWKVTKEGVEFQFAEKRKREIANDERLYHSK